jgi:glycosyltransferase involved in cell wall biosynthesis
MEPSPHPLSFWVYTNAHSFGILSRVRAVVVNTFFSPRAGGSAHMSEALARHVAAAGHEVLVVTAAYRDAPAEECRDGLRIVRLPSLAITSKLAFNYDIPLTATPRNARRLFRLLDDFQPDVVHQHGQFFDLTWMSSIWAHRRRVPRVLTVHTRFQSPFRLHAAAMAVADYLVVRPFVRLGDPYVVPVDVFVRDYVKARFGVRDDRIVDIPVGIESERFRETHGPQIRQRLGIGDRPMVLSLGHVIPLRDRLALIEAMPKLLAQYPDLVVVVAGRIYDDRFVRRARELGVDHALVLAGEITKNDVPNYAAAADVEGHDLQGLGFGMASLEMLAAGVPVVSVVRSDNYPTAHFVDGEHLILAASNAPDVLASAIARLIADPELRKRVGGGGQRLIAEQFSMDRVTQSYLELYERAVDERR